MSSISVILRTYSEARWSSLLAAVRSVQQQTRPPEELVLVVDHNPDLYERLRAALPTVVVVPNRGAAGSSGAWNAGLQVATGDILAFIDDDAVAAPDWLAELEAGYREPETIGVGGSILPVWVDGRPRWFPDEFAWVVGCTYRGLPVTETSVRNLIGCNMSFRRQAFDLAGGFLGAEKGIGHMGASPIGGDETEFCIRLKQRRPDAVMLYRPSARVHHRVPAGRTTWKYFLSRNFFEGRSKARIARLVGRQAGLEAERKHALSTVPLGVGRAVSDFVRLRDINGLGKASAMTVGLGMAAAGYVAGNISLRLEPNPRIRVEPGRATGGQLP